MRRQLLNEKSADEFKQELERQAEHGVVMMSLTRQMEKAGKSGHAWRPGAVQVFPPYGVP